MNNIIRNTILGFLFVLPALIIGTQTASAQQVTGLSDWVLFIDPGHSQFENEGLYNYTEAEKNLRVAWALRDMFFEQTDIDTVYLARQTDQDFISLEGRVALANTLNTDFYYSIHSDAGPSHVNSTLMLYGGWMSNGILVEKTPEGGKDYGAILDWDLTGAMRIDRRGNRADRDYYIPNQTHHATQAPYLYVNRWTNMASLLSEAGFHTNPGQQMLNLNHEWKTLEALSAFRSFLEWHNLDRPAIGVATGIIRDIETGLALNDVTVTIGEQTYTTDGWESLFNQYSNNPDQLRNGFYFIQGLTPLENVEVVFEKENYQTLTVDHLIVSNPNGLTEENLSFLDPLMTSVEPAVVTEVEPADELMDLIPGTPLVITFSRKMDKPTVEAAFSTDPAAPVSFSWPDDFTLVVNTTEFAYLQDYTITIDGTIAMNEITGQFLDGDADGTEGGDYVLNILMSDEDTDPPAVVEQWPAPNSQASHPRPVIRLIYDEEIMEESIPDDAITLATEDGGASVEGIFDHKVVDEKSILHFFPSQDLTPDNVYTVTVAAGLSDMFNNATESYSFEFLLLDQPITQTTVIDDFNTGIESWWHPNQAGQTVGIIPELTNRTHNNQFVVHSVNSTGSMKLSYGWDTNYAGLPYIRQYLPPTASQNNTRFNIDDVLQLYVFGDGSNNELRIMIRDGLNHLETHEWITIDWTGWKLISWDLANDQAFGWVNGNGEIEGANFYIDGFHLRYAEGAAETGAIYFDHLHFIKRDEVQYPTTLQENWQDYDDFSTDLFPWITIDADSVNTKDPVGFTFPGAGEPFAFRVMNPTQTTPPIDGDYPAIDGDKYLFAMMSEQVNENKWLISPQLKATGLSELKFFARAFQGTERFRVLISLDDESEFTFDPNDFTQISAGSYTEVTDQWTQYTYYLGAYADQVYRFAIQYVSEDDLMLMLDHFEVGTAPTWPLSLSAEPADGGEVTGAGDYAEGQQVTVEANPATGFMFSHWADTDGNEVSTAANYTFAMPASELALVAHFTLASYDLTLKISPEGAGTVTGAGSYHYNEQVTAGATANEGYQFVNWVDRDGNVMSTDPVYQFAMPAIPYELTAVFEPLPQFYTLTLLAQPEEGGEVYGAGDYEEGEELFITAQPADGFLFVKWTDHEDQQVSTEAMYSFSMPAQDITYTAHFQPETSVDDLSAHFLKVYPNPVGARLHLDSDQEIRSLKVTDITGKTIHFQSEINNNSLTFDMSNLDQGIYILHIGTAAGMYSRKVQKIKQ